MITPVLPDPPPSGRYRDSGRYGFWLEWPLLDARSLRKASIDLVVAAKENGDYVELVLNPQQISFGEPVATAVTFTQGGGKFVESRGGLVKQAVIQGTTGYMPTKKVGGVSPTSAATEKRYHGLLVDRSPQAEESRAKRSGFAAFYALRQLFRTFMHQRRLGTFVRMHYMDFLGDDFWIIEPQSFSMQQAARQPFMRNYEIRFTCLEPSGSSGRSAPSFTAMQSAFHDLPVPTDSRSMLGIALSSSTDVGALSSVDVLGRLVGSSNASAFRVAIGRYRTMVANGRQGLQFVSGLERAALESVLYDMSSIVNAVDETNAAARGVVAIHTGLFVALDASIAAAFDAFRTVRTFDDLSDGVLFEWNEFLLEVRRLGDHLQENYGSDARGGASPRYAVDVQNFADVRTNRAASEVIPETGRPLVVNPFIGVSGLEAVTDVDAFLATRQFRSEPVHVGESVFDFARRTLGSVHRFVEIVLLNDLSYPFVVPYAAHKPSGTVAWGEYLKVPAGAATSDVGEAKLAPSIAFSGAASAVGTNSQIVDGVGHASWRPDQWAGFTVRVTSGFATADPERVIVSNTEDTLEVNRPWTQIPTIGDEYAISLVEFSLRVPPNAEQIAFGRDLLLVWNQKKGSRPNPFEADILYNARGSLATVSGMENYHQALMLKMTTPRGTHPFHPMFGVGLPIGRPFGGGDAPLYNFFVRQSLLDDPRTSEVKNSKLEMSGTAVSYQADVTPVNVHKIVPVNLVVGR